MIRRYAVDEDESKFSIPSYRNAELDDVLVPRTTNLSYGQVEMQRNHLFPVYGNL